MYVDRFRYQALLTTERGERHLAFVVSHLSLEDWKSLNRKKYQIKEVMNLGGTRIAHDNERTTIQ